jgi:hypothetical protein
LYLYNIKIKTNIKQKFNRKTYGKVTDFFGLGRTRPNHFGWGCTCSAQKTVEKLFIVHVNSGVGIDAREREKGGGKGRGKPDVAAVLTVALVVLLPNEAVVHWGAASPVDSSSSSSSSSLCAFPLVLLPLFFLFSLSLLLLLLLSVFFPFLSLLFGYFF